ncbi:uncharacterized protein [Periplaneta americana]|uniref:uncharacterized protein n=1 Tax=Periplaneta americana TaxID=6978 RepID=UPI0037E9A842
MLGKDILVVLLVIYGAHFLRISHARRNGTRRCRPLGDDCIAPRMMMERVKLLVGGRRTNRFGKIGGINSFSDIGYEGLTEFRGSGRRIPQDTSEERALPEPIYRSHEMPGRVDEDLLTLKLLVSSILRDNVVTLTGYLSYKCDKHLTPSLHVALNWIYRAFQRREIHTTELLSALDRMAFEDPENQLLIFFSELEKIAPDILKCSAAVWKESITKKEIALNSIIRPDGESKIVDILANIDPQDIRRVKEDITFSESVMCNMSSKISQMMGPLIAGTMSAISDGSIKLSQTLLATLILHLPVNRFDAEVEEASRFLVDVLRENRIQPWESVSDISEHAKTCPFRIVRSVLKRILNSPNVTCERVKDAVAYLLPQIVPPSVETVSKFQSVMAPVVVKPKLDVLLLMSYLNLHSFPLDISEARDRITEAISSNVLDVYSILFGFIRFDYTTPEDLIIGLTNRIRRRYFDLDDEVMDAVKALNSFLVFRRNAEPFSTWVPKGVFDVTLMLEAFGSPAIPKNIRKLAKRIIEMLVKENIPWRKLLSETTFTESSNPRKCAVKILRHLVKFELKNNEFISKLMNDFLSQLNENGEPQTFIISEKMKTVVHDHDSSEYDFYMKNISLLITANTSTLYEYLSRIDLYEFLGSSFNASLYQNDHNLLHAILTKSLSTDLVQQNVFLLEGIKVKLAELANVDKNEANEIAYKKYEEDEKRGALPDYPGLISLLPDLPDDRKEFKKRSVKDLLTRSDLPVILGPEFKPSSYKSKGKLLQGVLNAALEKPEIKNNETLVTAILEYRGNTIMHGYGDQMISWKAITRKVDFSNLLTELVDYDSLPDDVADAYDEMAIYISNVTLFDYLQFGFNTFGWRTKAKITIGVLNHIMRKDIVPVKIKEAIKNVIPYIKTTQIGEEEPRYIDTVTEGHGDKLFKLST